MAIKERQRLVDRPFLGHNRPCVSMIASRRCLTRTVTRTAQATSHFTMAVASMPTKRVSIGTQAHHRTTPEGQPCAPVLSRLSRIHVVILVDGLAARMESCIVSSRSLYRHWENDQRCRFESYANIVASNSRPGMTWLAKPSNVQNASSRWWYTRAMTH